MSRFLSLLVFMTVCVACNNESNDTSEALSREYRASEVPPKEEYNEEELLSKIEANPNEDVGSIVDSMEPPSWDTPPVALSTPSAPNLGEIGLEGFEGLVGLWITITVDGIVDNVRIIRSSGHPELDSLAVDSVQKIVFAPAKENGKPIEISIPVPYHFGG